MTLQCAAAGCIRPATDTGYRDGVLLWAACDEHTRAVQPKIDHRGRELSIPGRMLQESAKAAAYYRYSLAVDRSIDLWDEIAEEVLEALTGTPAMRAMLRSYLEERAG